MRKTIIIILLILIGVVLLIPTLIFVSYFRHSIISAEITEWGAFGSYMSGTFGTLISFFSLIVLGYITYVVGKNSNKESKNLFLLKKRIEAYDELMKYIPSMNSISVVEAKRNFKSKFDELIKQDETPERYMDILKSLDFFLEFHYFLFNFNARYNHIFKYDFNSSSYKNLLKYSKNFKNSILLLYENFEPTQTKGNNLALDNESYTKMTDYLIEFINELKEELE